MARFWQRLLVAALIASGLCAAVWFLLVGPLHYHNRWYGRVRQDLYGLAHKRPPEVPKGQWEFIVGWTINLHGNCAQFKTYDLLWREGFAAELERRLAGPVTLADVEWVWDEYARHTMYGKGYSDRWRPTRADGFPQAHEGCFGIQVD